MSSKTAPEPAKAWSLATRLTLWYAASSFVFLAAFSGFLYWALIHQLETEDDQFMAEKVELVRVLLRNRSARRAEGSWDEASRPAASVYLRVLSADGKVLLTTPGMDAALPSTLFPEAREAGPIQGQERWLPD